MAAHQEEEHTNSRRKEIEGCNKKKKPIPRRQTFSSSEKEKLQKQDQIIKTAGHDQQSRNDKQTNINFKSNNKSRRKEIQQAKECSAEATKNQR